MKISVGNFHNFARRETCKGCGEHKGENEVVQDRRQGVQPGDWSCGNVHNSFVSFQQLYLHGQFIYVTLFFFLYLIGSPIIQVFDLMQLLTSASPWLGAGLKLKWSQKLCHWKK
jgi:hypothetical protein